MSSEECLKSIYLFLYFCSLMGCVVYQLKSFFFIFFFFLTEHKHHNHGHGHGHHGDHNHSDHDHGERTGGENGKNITTGTSQEFWDHLMGLDASLVSVNLHFNTFTLLSLRTNLYMHFCRHLHWTEN